MTMFSMRSRLTAVVPLWLLLGPQLCFSFVPLSSLGHCSTRADRSLCRYTSPSSATDTGLTLPQIGKRLKFEVTDLDEGAYGLDSNDPAYGIEIVKVTLQLKPSLGIGLEELSRGRDGRGMTLVGALEEGGNAQNSGKVKFGDMLCYLGREPNDMTRVEGFDLDSTMAALTTYAQKQRDSITLVLKRLVKRQTMQVTFQYSPGEDPNEKPVTSTLNMLAGSNLRKEMQRQNLPVYDRRTPRFDQPFITGNCAGEGICGTCLVQVLEGKEHLNPPDAVEKLVIDKWKGANWRLSCRTVVGTKNEAAVVRFKLQPQKGSYIKLVL